MYGIIKNNRSTDKKTSQNRIKRRLASAHTQKMRTQTLALKSATNTVTRAFEIHNSQTPSHQGAREVVLSKFLVTVR